MLPFLLLLDDPQGLVARANQRVAADPPCVFRAGSTDITVCGRRNADRFRVPLTITDPADPRNEPVPAERERLLHRTTPVADLSPFLVGGGMVGVAARIDSSGPHVSGQRKLAP